MCGTLLKETSTTILDDCIIDSTLPYVSRDIPHSWSFVRTLHTTRSQVPERLLDSVVWKDMSI